MDDGCIWANRFLSIYIYILFKILIHSEKWIQIERLKNVLELGALSAYQPIGHQGGRPTGEGCVQWTLPQQRGPQESGAGDPWATVGRSLWCAVVEKVLGGAPRKAYEGSLEAARHCGRPSGERPYGERIRREGQVTVLGVQGEGMQAPVVSTGGQNHDIIHAVGLFC